MEIDQHALLTNRDREILCSIKKNERFLALGSIYRQTIGHESMVSSLQISAKHSLEIENKITTISM